MQQKWRQRPSAVRPEAAGPILRGTFACAADFSRVLIALLCVVQRGSPFDKTAAPEEEPPLSVL